MGYKNYLNIILLGLVVVLAGYLRLVRLNESPGTVNWDEAAVGYNAYALLKVGRDEFGVALPVSLRSFDDYKPAAYSYLAVPGMAIWGLGEVTTRLPSVIMGVLLVVIGYLIAIRLTGRQVALATAVFIAISPWAIHFSRIAFEANVAMVMLYLGLALVMWSRGRTSYVYLSIGMMVVSMYTYHSQRAIALPVLITMLILFRRNFASISWMRLGTIIVVGLIPLAINFATAPVGSRLASTNLFKLWPVIPGEFNGWLYSPLFTMAWLVVGHYLAYFSPANIFLRGSVEPILRIPSVGLLPVELFPMWLWGWWKIVRTRSLVKWVGVLVFWLPLPGVITWNWFSVVRTLGLYPLFCLVSAAGVVALTKRLKWIGLVTLVLIGCAGLYSALTTILYYPVETFGEFQPGFEHSIPYLLSQTDNYDKIIVESPQISPYIFLLFYGHYPPAKYLAEAGYYRKNSGTEDYAFGKFQFRKIGEGDLGKNNLLMGPVTTLVDYKVEELKRMYQVTTRDFNDLAGYISFRIVGIK